MSGSLGCTPTDPGSCERVLHQGPTAQCRAARIRIDEPRASQYPLRLPHAGQSSAFWRAGAGAWADDPAGATPRADGGDAGRPRVRRRGVPPSHAGLLPRGGASPQSIRSGRPHQASAAAQVTGLDSQFRAAAIHSACATAGAGSGLARQTFRPCQPGVLVPWPLPSAAGSARPKAPAHGRGLAQHRVRAGQAVRPRRRQPDPSPLRRGQLAKAAAGGAGHLPRRRRGLLVQRGRREALT